MSRHLGDWRDTSGVSRAGILSARRYVGITILWLNLYVPFDECLLSDWASNFQTHSNRSIKASALAICTGHLVTGQSYQDNIPLTVNEVNCTGDEATLSNCSVIYPASNCSNRVGAGVSCYSSKSSVNCINPNLLFPISSKQPNKRGDHWYWFILYPSNLVTPRHELYWCWWV